MFYWMQYATFYVYFLIYFHITTLVLLGETSWWLAKLGRHALTCLWSWGRPIILPSTTFDFCSQGRKRGFSPKAISNWSTNQGQKSWYSQIFIEFTVLKRSRCWIELRMRVWTHSQHFRVKCFEWGHRQVKQISLDLSSSTNASTQISTHRISA